jgi:putative tricarboxylic transport membrane protein
VGAQGSAFALVLLLGFGLIGFVMRRFGYPLAPALVGAILGPLAEEQLRRGLMINRGDWMFLLTSNIALTIYAIAILAVFGPRLWPAEENSLSAAWRIAAREASALRVPRCFFATGRIGVVIGTRLLLH